MYKHSMYKHKQLTKDGRGSARDKIAIGAAVFGLVGVVTANYLSRATQRGELPALVLARPGQKLKSVADSARSGQQNGVVTLTRSVGVDSLATATIPAGEAHQRCAQTRHTITRSVGVEGYLVAQSPGCADDRP